MTATYLSRLEFRNFRTFGHFDIDLPPAPGLTLLVGPNGLGKSSFFDGIEWCLTGHIQRFRDFVAKRPEKDYLTRRDAAEDSHAVSLTFSSGKPLQRSAFSGPDDTNLMAVLKKQDWGEIKELDAYLALTHFLGQSAQQRFTSRKRSEQWEALKGPSGIDRLEKVRLALRGRATTTAFSKRLQLEAAAIEVATQALARWRDDRARLHQLQAAAQAAGTPSRQGIERDLAALAAACESTLERPIVMAADADATARIIALRALIDEAEREELEGHELIERLRDLASRYASLAAASDPGDVASEAAHRTLAASTAALTDAALRTRVLELSVSDKAGEKTAAEQALERSIRLVGEARALAEAETAHAALVEQARSLTAALTTAGQAHVNHTRDLAAARALRVTLAGLQEQLEARKQEAQRAASLVTSQLDAQLLRARAASAQADADAAAPLVARLQADRSGLDVQIVAAEAEYQNAQRRASDLADALATVAKHLNDHDEACPVCAAPYPPGAIKLLAETAAQNQDKELSGKAQALEDLRRLRDDTSAQLTQALERNDRAKLARDRADAAELEVREACDGLESLLQAREGEDLVLLTGQRLAVAAREIADIEAEIALSPATLAELEAIVEEAALAHQALSSEQAKTERDTAEALQRVTTHRDALGEEAMAAGMDALIARTVQDRGAHELAQAGLARARVDHAAALAHETSARHRFAQDEAALTATRVAITRARSERANLVGEWQEAGCQGEPSDGEATNQSAALSRRISALRRHGPELDRLAQAVRCLVEADEMETLLERMADTADKFGVVDTTLYEQHLNTQLEDARAAHEATLATQTAVKAHTEELKGKADRFSSDFLEPLNGLIDDFNQALLSTPGETIQFNAEASVNRTSLEMKLRYADKLDNARFDTRLAPQLVLSEGQMAANGFSILCAASIAYPWSNWRALLLDDPLQHNDIIHAAAFADVMRNLVEYENYQLLMSSHDRAESEFLFRKFDAAGLPCTMVMLTAPSRDGVLSEAPRYNAAASRLMATRLAAAS